MPRTPRYFVRGKAYETCFRIEEGLPLVCSPYMRVIIEGILATAFAMYDQQLVNYVIMGNHIHLHLIVGNPEFVDDLHCYIKRELSHAINNLLGRPRHTVWQEGYDAVLILDAEQAIERAAYFYLNPARADLVESITEYPGMSSWQALLSDDGTLVGRRIPRETIPALPKQTMSLQEQQLLAERLLEQALPPQEIRVDPLAFLQLFPESKNWDRETVRTRIIALVQSREARLRKQRKYSVIGAHALKLQSIWKKHQPKKFGKKMWVFGSTKEIRQSAIRWLKEQFHERRQLKQNLSHLEFLRRIPPGFYSPGGFLRANLNPLLVPI